MKIRGWNVDGFGVFQNYEVRDLPEGLTVFHGANEAGKSTLLAFLRGMLFGFPDRRAMHARYLPVHGGRHGGRLMIDANGMSLVIDRDATRKSAIHVGRSDGRSGSVEDLQRALAGADEQLFRSIFAFSLTELQTFESLTVDGIRDRIFTAGIAGAGRSARAVIDTLEDRARLLLRRSSRARIPVLAAELTRVREALEASRIAAVQYRDHVAEEERSEEETHRLAAALAAARMENDHHIALIDLWPVWVALHEAQLQRSRLSPVSHLAADAEVRLAALNELLRTTQRGATAVQAEIVAVREEYDRLEGQRDACAALHEVEAFHLELPLRRDRLRTLDGLRQSLAAANQDVAARVTQLGSGWNEARFATFAAQPPALDEVRFWDQQLDAAESARERATVEHQRVVRRQQELVGERDAVRARLPAKAPPSLELLDERDAAIRRLRSHIVDLRALQSDTEASDRVMSDTTLALRAFEAASVPIRAYWFLIGSLIALLAGGGLAGWRESLGDRTNALIAGGIGLALMLGFEILRRWAARREHYRRDHIQTLVDEIEEAKQAREASRAQAGALRAEVNIDREALELGTLSYRVIDEEDAQLQRQRAARARWDEISAHVKQLDASVEAADRRSREAADQRAVTERALDEAQDGWHEWLRPCGLDGAGTPAEVMALLASIDTCREVWMQRHDLHNRTAFLEQDVAAWEGSAHDLIRRAESGGSMADPSGDACLDRIAELHARWLIERERQEAQNRLAHDLNDRVARLAELEGDCRAIDVARMQLFQESGASSEEEFRHQLALRQRALELDRAIADGERQIAARAGAAKADAVRRELSSGDLDAWHAQRAVADAARSELEAQRDDAVRRHHDARRVRRELEDSAAVATLEAEYEGLKAELDAAIDEWRVTTGARALIEETLREFERSRQPAVLAQAGKVLATVTNGRYTGVLQDDDQIVVLDPGGGRKGPGELSRGTVEQLYLCVRLGLAGEFGRRSACLPIIMDDVLVNFDPERAYALAVALAQFSQTHQVLFFTCQPATRDLLVEVGGAARVVELGINGTAALRVDQPHPAP